MKRLWFAVAIIISTGFIISCKPCDKSKLPDIENRLSELDQMQQKIREIQTDSIAVIYAKLKKDIDGISAICPPPAMSQTAQDFKLLQTTNRGLSRLERNKGKLIQEIETSKNQFNILKQDIQNCVWTTDSIDYFYQSEFQIFNQIAKKTEDLLTFVERSLSIGDTLCPKLRYYLDSVAAANNIDFKQPVKK